MPCSSRACRLENELANGSLGTIFHFPRSLHLSSSRNPRSSLARRGRGTLIPRRQFPQTARALRLRRHAPGFRGRGWTLVGHLGERDGCDRESQDRRPAHGRCEALHNCGSADPQHAFTRAADTIRNRRAIRGSAADRGTDDPGWWRIDSHPICPRRWP